MDIGKVTVKEILERRLGKEKASRVLKEINASYQKGKRGNELETDLKTALENEGSGSGDITITIAQVVPTY